MTFHPAATGRRLVVSAVLAGLCSAGPALAASSTPSVGGTYGQILTNIQHELGQESAEDTVMTYVAAVLTQSGEQITATQVEQSLNRAPDVVCEQDTGSLPKDRSTCIELIDRAQALVAREEQARRLGRDLQAIASSAELATDAYPGMGTESLKVSEALRTIWGLTSSGETLDIHTWPTDNDTIKNDLNQIASAFGSLSTEEQAGALWQMLYGVRFARNERGGLNPSDSESNPVNGANTERRFLWKSYTALGDALEQLQTDLLATVPDASESVDAGHTILFPTHVAGGGDQTLVVWVTNEDVGLRAQIPLEPPLPALLDGSTAIPGGTWPPAPPGPTVAPLEPSNEDDSRGLCLDPIAKRGHLCRAPGGEESPCTEPITDAPDGIVLASCIGQSSSSETAAGPGMCDTIEWRKGGFDQDHQCQPELTCADVCDDVSGSPNASTQFHVYKKVDTEDGVAVARACVKNGAKLLPAYLLIEAASGLRLTCEETNNSEPSESLPPAEQGILCCDQIGQRAMAMCQAMEEDGVFMDAAGNRLESSTFEPFTVASCATAFANDECQNMCGLVPEGYLDEVIALANQNPAGLPASCEDALTTDRVQKLINEADGIDQPCDPERITEMDNTILANACFAGRCLEDTLKLHQVTPRSGPLTAVDNPNPWLTDEHERTRTEGPHDLAAESGSAVLPAYAPARIVGDFDRAFCQLNGLPPLTPAALCAVDPLRRINLPLVNPFEQQSTLDQQRGELAADQQAFLQTGLPAGVRLGDDMFVDMIRTPIASLTQSLSTVTDMLQELSQAEFPKDLCPLTPDEAAGTSSSGIGSESSSLAP